MKCFSEEFLRIRLLLSRYDYSIHGLMVWFRITDFHSHFGDHVSETSP